MERCEDYLHLLGDLVDVLSGDRSLHDSRDVDFIHLVAEYLDDAVLDSLLVIRGLYILEDVDLCDLCRYDVSVLRSKLGSVSPVSLIAVIFLRIMARGDVDSGDRLCLSYRE